MEKLLESSVKATRIRFLMKAGGRDSKDELEDLIGQECVYCSDLMIKDIDLALVQETDLLL
jgi:uncharacterized protein YbcI